MKSKKKLALASAIIAVAVFAAGATLAWLTDKTDPLVNTFTVGDVDINLAETTDTYKMIPGYSIKKDPVVSVDASSEKCYVFVKVEEKDVTYKDDDSNDVTIPFSDYIDYVVAADWTKLTGATGVDNVWYQIVDPSDESQSLDLGVIGYMKSTDKGDVFVADEVLVKDTVTKEMLEKAAVDAPKLTFTAYAVQFMKDNDGNFSAADAWAEVSK